MSQITDLELKTLVVSALGYASAADLDANPKWATIIPQANTGAWQEISGVLAQRGYTPAQIDAWDRGAEFNRDIGLFWCLVRGGGLGPASGDSKNIDRLDRRKELWSVQVTTGRVQTNPTPADDAVGYGTLCRDDDLFPPGWTG